MTEYIQRVLGCEASAQKFSIPNTFPMYLANGYAYKAYFINGIKCIAAKPYEFSLSNYKKHRKKMIELSGIPVILELDHITPYQRKVLIENKIPFVANNIQLYLPFLAISLTEKYNSIRKIDKFSPVTQLVFLYTYYKNRTSLYADELAKEIGYSVMSVHRAFKELTDCGLFNNHTNGRRKIYEPVMFGEELLKKAEPFLVNPVIKTIYCADKNEYMNLFMLGIYALSRKTMLSSNQKDVCYAISKKDSHVIRTIIPEEEAPYYTDAVQVELWSYDPGLLTNDECVDDISLIMTLKKSDDDRVQIGLEELRSKFTDRRN